MKKLFFIFILIIVSNITYADDAAKTDDIKTEDSKVISLKKWDFYGSVRMSMFHTTTVSNSGDDSSEMLFFLQDDTQIGVNVTVSDSVDATVEFRAEESDANIKIAKATYRYDANSMSVGHQYVPSNFFISKQSYKGHEGKFAGNLYTGSQDSIIYSLMDGGLKLAFISPSKISAIDGSDKEQYFDETNTNKTIEINTSIPKIEVGFTYQLKGYGKLGFVFGKNSISAEYATKNYYIDSHLYSVWGEVVIGPVTIGLSSFNGQNLGNYGVELYGTTKNRSTAYYNDVTDEIQNAETSAFMGTIGVVASKTISVEMGYGFISAEPGWEGMTDAELADPTEADTASLIYLQADITLTKGVRVIPEVGLYDDLHSPSGDAEESSFTYIGAKFQVDF